MGNGALEMVTRNNRGLQRVTRGYKELHGLQMVEKVLQGGKGGYKGLQGVTRDNRGLQEVTKG